MANINAQEKHATLVNTLGDPIQAQRVLNKFVEIVRRSFVEEAKEGRAPEFVRESEIKRRTNILYDWFLTLRKDCGYSTTHALDVLPMALRARLDGLDFTPPPAERTWMGGN
jgi:hypothetical protein